MSECAKQTCLHGFNKMLAAIYSIYLAQHGELKYTIPCPYAWGQVHFCLSALSIETIRSRLQCLPDMLGLRIFLP